VDRSELIGDLVDHSTRTLIISDDYTLSIGYYGDVAGAAWNPKSGETAEDTLHRLVGTSPEYLIVTDTRLDAYKQVEPILAERYPVLRSGDDWVVYDLRRLADGSGA
jgi:hypothetical protein